jgi:hypothetical protein
LPPCFFFFFLSSLVQTISAVQASTHFFFFLPFPSCVRHLHVCLRFLYVVTQCLIKCTFLSLNRQCSLIYLHILLYNIRAAMKCLMSFFDTFKMKNLNFFFRKENIRSTKSYLFQTV